MPDLSASDIAALTAIVALVHSVWVRHRSIVDGARRDVRRVAVVNIERFNGVMNASAVGGAPPDLAKLARLYAQTRQAFEVNRHQFGWRTRRTADSMISNIEQQYVNKVGNTIRLWHSFMKFVEQRTK